MLLDILRQGKAALGINPETWKRMEETLRERGCKTYSRDYRTVYIPFTNVFTEDETEASSLTMNKSYSFDTFFPQVNMGRAVIMINPALREFFKDIDAPTFVEEREAFYIEAKARKNATLEDAVKASPWLFKLFIIK